MDLSSVSNTVRQAADGCTREALSFVKLRESFSSRLSSAVAIDKKSLSFCLEDTVEGCYRDVVDALLDKEWTRIPYDARKKSIIDKKR